MQEGSVSLIYSSSGLGKCLSGNARISLSTGEWITVLEVGNRLEAGEKIAVLGLDQDTLKVRPFEVSRFYRNGQKMLRRITTRTGRTIDVTLNHPLLHTIDDRMMPVWKEAGAFTAGDRIAVPRVLPAFGSGELPDHVIKLIAYHIANGSYTPGATKFSTKNQVILSDWTEALNAFSPNLKVRFEGKADHVITKIQGVQRDRNDLGGLLFELGFWGCRSATKFVPDVIFTLPKDKIALFLSRYLGCDGAVHADNTVSFSSASELLLRQIRHLLLRFGIHGRTRIKYVKGKPYWEWSTRDQECRKVLAEEITLFGKDPVPVGAQKHNHNDLTPVSSLQGVKNKRTGKLSLTSRGYLQETTSQYNKLYKLAHSDIFWDEVKSVEDIGIDDTFDLTVPGAENFVADDIFAHNTADTGYSFPRALFLAAPGALTSIEKTCGYTPRFHEVRTIMDVIAMIDKLKGHFPAIVVDDFSFLAQQTIQNLEAQKFTGFKLWAKLNETVFEFRDKARYAGIHVALSCWEQPPKTNSAGSKVRGGPKLPGQLPEQLPAMCDIVLRGVQEPRRQPWPVVYRCNPDPSWILKDRFNVANRADPAPMNLGEILRAGGVSLDRHVDMPQQEERVEKIAGALSGEFSEDLPILNEFHSKLIGSGVSKFETRWTLRDASDRAVLRKQIGIAESMFVRPGMLI